MAAKTCHSADHPIAAAGWLAERTTAFRIIGRDVERLIIGRVAAIDVTVDEHDRHAQKRTSRGDHRGDARCQKSHNGHQKKPYTKSARPITTM